MRKPIPTTPLHPQIRNGRFRLIPINMNRVKDITDEQFETVQKVVLSIYTDMTNNSFSLPETLAAIYLSGVSHALSVAVEGHLPNPS